MLVEQERGTPWGALVRQRGDWARDMVLSLARRRSGLTWRELGECVGGMDYRAVAKAVERFEIRLSDHKSLRRVRDVLLSAMANVNTCPVCRESLSQRRQSWGEFSEAVRQRGRGVEDVRC